MQKITDLFAAGFTGTSAAVALGSPEWLPEVASLGMLQQWGWMAAAASLLFLVGLYFNLHSWRSSARFLSGCVWGLVLLACLFTQTLSVFLGVATLLFLIDFLAAWKDPKCQKNNPTSSLTAS